MTDLFQWAVAQFWTHQIPATILGPEGNGVVAQTDFGERVVFPDQASIEFFLLGYQMGEQSSQQDAQAPEPAGLGTLAEILGNEES